MRRARPGLIAIAAVLAASACTAEVGLNGSTPAPGGGAGDASQARRDLAALRIAAEGDGAGYDREDFGVRWRDIDRNGCDQRNDVLARDLREVTRRGRCVVVSGTLHDPYTGRRIAFSKSDAAEVQIDHLYPLALAWRMGASRWPESRREEFANDHDNLLAVWGVPNGQKGDSGPGEWRPRKEYQCTYAIKYVAVAAEYRLPVTRADRDALESFLDRC
ncbi:HNH endonuclease family protein [Thermomonospora amylolytica]|uniref:HNH endonuclease family protein n=1 Tax=Thermomonospora amylolytica TaxID=1411117 RepID=UPI000E6CA2C8|nr:HNH endonuclease family protein [Thermomonospora amylolytica]